MKRFVLFVLIVTMMLSCINVFADGTQLSQIQSSKEFNDVLIIKSEIGQLEDMGVMTDVGRGAIENITRSEMAKIVTQLMGIETIYELCSFDDVSRHNPYSWCIDYVSKQNIMTGYNDNLFLPDKDISYYEVIKTIVTLLGYEPLAIQKGGYPSGFMNVANSYGMIIFPSGYDRCLTKEEIAKILIKAVDVPIMVQTSYGSQTTYAISNDTLKTKYLLSETPDFSQGENTNNDVNNDLHTFKIDCVNTLIRYGIITGDQDGGLRLYDTITRAEAVSLILKTNGIYRESLNDYSFEHEFEDAKGHWAEKEIMFAFHNGLANGTGEACFNPDEKITVQEFAKIVLSLLGYKNTAEESGTYPHGYMLTSHRLGLFNGLYLNGPDEISRLDASVILSNSLDIPVMKQSGFGADIKYIIMDGKNGSLLETLRMSLEIK